MSDLDRILLVIRGLPGSGKSTLAGIIADIYWEADMFFAEGKFDPKLLKRAHQWCKDRVEGSMEDGVCIIAVSNTSTQAWEMEHYKDLAEEYGYKVHQIIVENTHGGQSVHQVPEETIQKMRDRFEVTL